MSLVGRDGDTVRRTDWRMEMRGKGALLGCFLGDAECGWRAFGGMVTFAVRWEVPRGHV